MIKLRMLAVFFCLLIMNHLVTSSDQSQDRTIRVFSIPDGRVEERMGSVYCFYPDKTNPVWRGSNWNVCEISVDPKTEKIRKIEVKVEESGKQATYRLPDENIHFKNVVVSVHNQKRLESKPKRFECFRGFGQD